MFVLKLMTKKKILQNIILLGRIVILGATLMVMGLMIKDIQEAREDPHHHTGSIIHEALPNLANDIADLLQAIQEDNVTHPGRTLVALHTQGAGDFHLVLVVHLHMRRVVLVVHLHMRMVVLVVHMEDMAVHMEDTTVETV